ncbi:HU family DNA-binding protein [Bacteroides fragilis]|nr:HU family DNA-binding protein [Bacteroides fragilis]
MPINYVVRKKKDQSGNEVKELYYAVPSAIQNKGVSEKQLAEDLHDNSSLSAGEVLSVLEQLPKAIARHMKEGRTVTIRGLGTFYPALSSEGCETPRRMYAQQSQIDTHLLPGRYCVHLRRETLRIREYATAIYKEAEAR